MTDVKRVEIMKLARDDLKILRRLFVIRHDVYGTAKGTRVWQVKEPLTDADLVDHLMGRRRVGVYAIAPNGNIKWGCVDVDRDDFAKMLELKKTCQDHGLPVYIERSKSRGFHGWAFMDRPVAAYKVRAVFKNMLTEIVMENTEFFPKQDTLRKNAFGSFVFLPLFGYLGKNRSSGHARTVFVDDLNIPHSDQVRFLKNVEFITEAELDAVIRANGLDRQPASQVTKAGHERVTGNGLPCFSRMMQEGVEQGMRNEAALRISVNLFRNGLPLDFAMVLMREWNKRNGPPMEVTELEKTVSNGYSGRYGYGCFSPLINQYCDPSCPIFRKHNDNRGSEVSSDFPQRSR